jgi:uncharacterized membrane protein
MLGSLIGNIRPLLHPMLVHFPIALLLTSIALDWSGLCLRMAHLTRAGFYSLVLGALGAGLAALSGPDHVSGDPQVMALLVAHQSFALITVSIAVALVAVRFIATDGIAGRWAVVYLACTLALGASVALTGYYGGELTYHQGVGVATAISNAGTPSSGAGVPLVPVKPLTALLGLLSLIGLSFWMALGGRLAPIYYTAWWRTVRRERSGDVGSLIWTLHWTQHADGDASHP